MSKYKRIVTFIVTLAICLSVSILFVDVLEANAAIRLNKKSATIYVGRSVSLKVKDTSHKVKWTSSDKHIAKVTSNGKVTGKKAGKAIITASVEDKKLKCKITVKKKGKAESNKNSENDSSENKNTPEHENPSDIKHDNEASNTDGSATNDSDDSAINNSDGEGNSNDDISSGEGNNSENMVWIPTKGGTKYHSKPSCSNMSSPQYVSKSEAQSMGYTACKKCY